VCPSWKPSVVAGEIRFLFGVLPGADPDAIASVLAGLPNGASGIHDSELDVVSVEVVGDADVANRALGHLSRSQLFTASFRDDAAVRRHQPARAARPARWDFVGDSPTGPQEAICETCGWTFGPAPWDEVDGELIGHENEVHGGLRYEPPYDD
jgi:hypothetical protein